MKKKLLIVEDDAGLRKYFLILLEQMGFEVSQARNGAEALSLLMEDDTFDLVMTDIDMPIMTGVELIEEMGKNGIQTPACVVTGVDDSSVIIALEKLGCRHILTKPVSSTELSKTIENVLKKNKPLSFKTAD